MISSINERIDVDLDDLFYFLVRLVGFLSCICSFEIFEMECLPLFPSFCVHSREKLS